MKNFQTVVQELLHNHERQRRYIALLTALCMLMAFTVSIILIEPAESMTGELACGMSEHIHNENCFTYTCGLEDDASHTHSAECRKLICEQPEHAHSENCYIHEDESTAQIMQINSPQFIDNGMPEGDSTSGDGAQPKAAVDEKTSFDSAPADKSGLPENALEIKDNQITISDLKIDGTPIEKSETDSKYHHTTDKDKASVEFNLKYHIDSVSDFSGYLYYKLPEGIVPDNGFYGAGKVVLGDDSKEIGHFAINENGFVSIHFNQTFIDKVNKGGYIDGFVNFKGSVSRNNTADGNRDLHIGKDDIIIDFPDKSFSVTKSGQAVAPDSVGGRPKVKWTITVHDLAKSDDTNVLSNYYLYDELFKDADNVEITFGDSHQHEKEDVIYEDGHYKFKEGFEGDVTFTFEKELTDDEYNAFVAGKTTTKNNVYLKDTENKTVSEDEATVTFENKVTMQKAGTADYVGEYIQWTVDVSRSLNQSLNGYQVQDDAIAKSEEIVVTSGGETLTEGASNDYTLDKEKGTITFNKDFADVKITYKQKRDTFKNQLNKENASGSIDNVANLIPPEGKPTTENPAKGNVSWNEPLTLTKDGTYDRFNDKIDWKITASTQSAYNMYPNHYPLDNYTITDPSLKNIELKDIIIEKATHGWSPDLKVLSRDNTKIILGTKDGNNEVQYAKITKTDDGLKVETIHNGGSQEGVHLLTITYSTEVTPEMKQNATGVDESKKVVTNTATDSKGHEVTASERIVPENKVEKKINSESSNIVEYDSEKNTETLKWQIDLTQDLGFKDKELTDVVAVVDNSKLSHYIASGQRDKISVQYEYPEGVFTDLPEGLYEIKFYASDADVTEAEENATKFKITFKEGTDVSTYRHIRITYETTADIESLKDDEKATFQNSATFDEKTETSTYTVERKDPNKVPTHKLTVEKSWAANITEKSEIQFHLQRTLNNTDWETYNVKEKRWDNNVETFSDDYLTTLNSDSNWTTTFENLEEHEKGFPDRKYTYRVTEVLTEAQKEIFESNVTNNDFKLTGDGQITIENSKKPDFEKIVDIEGAEDGKISVDKLLSDDDYYYIPYKITLSDFPANTNILIKDVIPDGFELAYTEGFSDWTNPEYDLNKHHPFMKGVVNGSTSMYTAKVTETWNRDQKGYFEITDVIEDRQEITFYSNSDYVLMYQIKISKSDLKSKLSGGKEFTITNTATVGEKTKPVTVTITGEVEQTAPEDETLLKKDVLRPDGSNEEYVHSNNGVIEYYVYVNPEGKKLSNTDSFDVVDDFTLNSMTSGDTTYTAEQLREMLETGLFEIKVEEISDFKQDSDGNITCTTGRNIDNFTYTVEENPYTTTKQDISESFSVPSNQECHIDNLNSGDKVIIEVTASVENPDFSQIHYRWQSGYIDGTSLEVRKTDGKNIAELTVPDGANCLYLNNWDKGLGTVSCTLTVKDKMVTTYESSSRLTITVPDETPLKITYRYEVTQDGNTMNTDTRFNASNKVSIATENASSSDELRDVTFRVNQAGAGATTGGNPSIRKFNIGTNKEVTGAKFYIAKYEEKDGTGKWHFVNEVKETTDDKNKTLHELKYSETGIGNESLPDGAAYIELSGTDKYELTGSSLQSGILYKIIEVKAPSGYQGDDAKLSGEGSLEALLKEYLANPEEFLKKSENSAYYNLVQRFVAVHYFKYGTTASTEIKKPANFKGNIMDVKSGGTISIPNNELIDIHATKTWVGEPGTSVTFELLWSTKKQSSGIPDDATAVTASALGLIGDFNNIRTIPGEHNETEATWNDLPNGLNDRPVYYYVCETSYTTSEGTFERQTDGTYKLQNGDTLGTYKPTYTGNGLNKDGTVTVTNSNGLVIQKAWLKSDKNPMNEGEIPADKIKCNIYGKVNSDSPKVLIEEDVILEKSDWKYEPTGEKLAKYTPYDYIIIEETEVHLKDDPDTEWTSVDVALYGYVRSSTSNVTDGVGTATLINRDNTPTDVDVSVEKVWSDGNSGHSGDNITVTLYSSTKSYTDAELGNLNVSSLPTDLTKVEGEGITNPFTLNNSNNWENTWNDLPYKSETGQRYYYYVLETTGKTGYTASYNVENNKTIITNSIPGTLTINKQWLNSKNEPVTPPDGNVNFKLYRRAKTKETQPSEPTEKIHIKGIAFGDSITYGTNEGYGVGTKYTEYLSKYLRDSGYILESYNTYDEGQIYNESDVGLKIEAIEGRIGEPKYGVKLDSTFNSVFLIAGTNNILSSNDTVEQMKERMISLIDKVYSASNDNVIVYVGSVPKLTYVIKDGKQVAVADGRYGETVGSEDRQKEWDKLVTEYNTALKTLIDEYKTSHPARTVIYVETGNAVGDHINHSDGIHPNDKGQQAIAEAFFNAINEHYDVELSSTVQENINGLPSDFYKSDGSVNTDLYEEVIDKAFTLSSENGWSETIKDLDKKDKNGNDYVYYIVEESTGNWTAAYTGNGQIINDSGATITVMNTVETLSLKVKKNWINHTATDTDTVKFNLYRTTDESKVKKSDLTPNTIEIENENFDVSAGVKDIKGESFELILGTSDFEIESISDGFAAVINENKITITPNGNEGDTGQLVVIDVYGNKLTIPLEIIKEPDLSLTIPDTLVEGETAEVKAMIGSKEVTPKYSFDREDIVKIEGDTITALKAGEVTITATSGDKTTTKHLTVNPWELTPDDENIEIKVRNSITIQSNKTITNAISSSDNVEVSKNDNGKALTIQGNTVGDAEITVTAGEKTKTITVNVVESAELKILKDGVDVTEEHFEIGIGETITFTTNKKIKNIQNGNEWNVEHKLIPETMFTLTGKNVTPTWEIKLTVFDENGNSKNIYVKVIEKKLLEVTPTSKTIQVGGTFELKPNMENVHYEITQSEDVISIEGNTVTAKKTGNATIHASCEGVDNTVDITVNVVQELVVDNFPINFNAGSQIPINYNTSKTIEQIKLSLEHQENKYEYVHILINGETLVNFGRNNGGIVDVTDVTSIQGISYVTGDDCIIITPSSDFVWESLVIKSNTSDPVNGNVEITYASESATSISLASLSEPVLMSAAEPTWTPQGDGTEMWSEEYVISSSGDTWEKTIPNLPLKDASGKTYYYWVVETNNDGFTKTYRFNDADATQDLAINAQSPGDGEIVITNKQKESSTTTMPSTGGNGARKYYTVGGMLLLMSACGWAMHRRKRVIPH